MSLTISCSIVAASKIKHLSEQATTFRSSDAEREMTINPSTLDDKALVKLRDACTSAGDGKSARAINAILTASAGVFSEAIPNFKAFQAMLELYLRESVLDGYIYVLGADGHFYPELVTSISFDSGSQYKGGRETPIVRLHTAFYGVPRERDTRYSVCAVRNAYSFTPDMVTRQTMHAALAARGIYRETPELKAAYEEALARYQESFVNAFARQFRATGRPMAGMERHKRDFPELGNAKFLHDLSPDDMGPAAGFELSKIIPDTEDGVGFGPGTGQIPVHPIVKLMNLSSRDSFWVHCDQLTPYVYDHSLRDKLILPASHRDLLDVLTADLSAFVDDFIEGKSAGNVILCKGAPGLGKTLTAEVYAELTEKPLLSIRAGELGSTAAEVSSGLKKFFDMGQRWGCVLLLDEADVFVVSRGSDIHQNAIVSEFLRSLEYFDGLLFMTTNRPDDIDEAIISRCAAIINYEYPNNDDLRLVWGVMAKQFNVNIPDSLIDELLVLFPKIAPRDIKMLLRLVLRVGGGSNDSLTIELFRRCAMFRAVPMARRGGALAAHLGINQDGF